MRHLVIIAFVLICTSGYAQYLPNNAQAFQYASLYNPAFTGTENFGDLKLSYRYQWSGFGEYAPKFINLAYNVRLKQPLDLSYNSLRISNPALLKAEMLPRKKQLIHGLGGNLFHSTIGPLQSIGGAVSYSLHYPLTSRVRLAVGGMVLVENRKLDISQISVADPDNDPYYQLLLSGSTSQTDLNLRAGLLLYGKNFYFGLSYLPVVNSVIQSASDLTALEQPFYRGSVQLGYAFQLNPDLTMKPSVVALLQMNNEVALDFNVKAYIQEKLWFGITYRDVQSGVGLVGFNLNEKLTASYSYEMSLGGFQQFSDGSHELVISFRLNNFKKQSQFTW